MFNLKYQEQIHLHNVVEEAGMLFFKKESNSNLQNLQWGDRAMCGVLTEKPVKI